MPISPVYWSCKLKAFFTLSVSDQLRDSGVTPKPSQTCSVFFFPMPRALRKGLSFKVNHTFWLAHNHLRHRQISEIPVPFTLPVTSSTSDTSYRTALPSGRFHWARSFINTHTKALQLQRRAFTGIQKRVNYYNPSCRGVGTCPHLSKKQKITSHLTFITVQDGKHSSCFCLLP